MLVARNTLNVYKDTSKMEDGFGAGIYSPELAIGQPFQLDRCTIFEAEVFAIWKAAELAFNASAGKSRVNIFVNSQAAIKAKTSYRPEVSGQPWRVSPGTNNFTSSGYQVIKAQGNEIVGANTKNCVRLSLENPIYIGKPMHYL